jgi:KaiC/GvpD/RAD55 family RecA-like ATPase
MGVTSNPDRLPFGIPCLDDILLRGQPSKHAHLVIGDPGSEQTMTAAQLIVEGKQRDERCVNATFSELNSLT